MTDAVRMTAELRRIIDLPRRRPDDDYSDLAAQMTEVLRRTGICPGKPDKHGLCNACNSPLTLRNVQALALHDIGVHRGGLLPIGVGEGKSLIFALSAWVLDAKNPIGFLPASLMRSMKDTLVVLRNHWHVPSIFLHSYEMLGREQASEALAKFGADAVICDEVHRVKNLDAACTRRIARFMASAPETPFVGMSGTIMRDSIHDFAPCLFWALKDKAPLPMPAHELDTWAQALEEPKPTRFGEYTEPPAPGALLSLCNPEELKEEKLKAARLGFRRRLVETPGVVATAGDGDSVNASIRVKGIVYDLKPDNEERFYQLRWAMFTPDGWELFTGVEVWMRALEMAIGFHSVWDPRPVKEWLEPRKKWFSFVRSYLGRSFTIDSPAQVEAGVLSGRIDDGGLLAAWLEVRDTYKPNTVEIWHDDSVLNLAAKWAKKPGIVWTSHQFFGERLAKMTGLRYFGAGGLDPTGMHIEKCTDPSIIASSDANRDGKNLQHVWSRNLLVGPLDGWDAMQQCIGRTHRGGQRADEVIVDILLGCREHVSAWRKAVAGTHAARDTVGGTPKLLLADIDFPSDDALDNLHGSRW